MERISEHGLFTDAGKPVILADVQKEVSEHKRFMDEKGVFPVKGAIDKAAEILGVTKVTVYSYLDETKGKRR